MSPTASSYALIGRQMASPTNTNDGGLSTGQKIGIGVGVGVGVLMLLALLGGLLFCCIKMKRRRSRKSAERKQVYDSPQSQAAPLHSSDQTRSSNYQPETQQNQTYSHAPTTRTTQQQYTAPSTGRTMQSGNQGVAAPPVTQFSQGY